MVAALLGFFAYQAVFFCYVLLSRPETLEHFRSLDIASVQNDLKSILYADGSDVAVKRDLARVFGRYDLIAVHQHHPVVYCMPNFFYLELRILRRGPDLTPLMFGRWAVYLMVLTAGLGVAAGLSIKRVPQFYRLDLRS